MFIVKKKKKINTDAPILVICESVLILLVLFNYSVKSMVFNFLEQC